MFTGLIESLGIITSQEKNHLEISVAQGDRSVILSDLAIGDSVAVDGICLTVETILDRGFIATVSPETVERTNLGKHHSTAQYVNLETSLRVGSKIGGHFVTGHIDGIGCLIESSISATSWEMCFGQPPGQEAQWQQYVAPYLVTKGSIAVNGISLTVAECAVDSSWFKVAVIPHTYQETNLSHLKSGDLVNLESDILGKYVERLLGERVKSHYPQENVSLSFLAENGYV
ncbi:MAG: riboflavin synthase [Xenococcaceae cyanobacterium MO_207.B15]|nr:riboflavin synthase [Xenococcaceae cyanobacterium MO_207.B15]MDJ0744221.1 riboflavin synthase [Xenococcaceae cyanobacterium MO_167.B27]